MKTGCLQRRKPFCFLILLSLVAELVRQAILHGDPEELFLIGKERNKRERICSIYMYFIGKPSGVVAESTEIRARENIFTSDRG